ncbi:MAG: VWA domain-containing protein [Elusimicrobiota bacterium]
MHLFFSSPLYFLALPVILIPVLIHLLYRKKLIKLRFSETKYINLAVQRSVKSYRLRQYLLLLLRVLALILIILYFSRPIMSLVHGGKGKESTICFLIDTSLSMSYKPDGVKSMLDSAKDAVLKIAGMLNNDEQYSVFSFDNAVYRHTDGFIKDKTVLRDALKKVVPSAAGTQPGLAFEQAYGLLSSTSAIGTKVIVVLTDQCSNVWEALRENEGLTKIPGFYETVRVVVVDTLPPGSEPKNHYLSKTVVKPPSTGEDGLVDIEITNTAGQQVPVLTCKIKNVGNDTLISAGFIPLPPKGKVTKSLPLTIEPGTEVYACIQTDTDNLMLDDKFYTVAWSVPSQKVLIINGEPGYSPVDSEAYYFITALSPKRDTKNVVVDVYNSFPEEGVVNFAEYGLIVLANLSLTDTADPDGISNTLSQYLRKKGNVLITLGSNVVTEKYYSALNPLLPAVLGGMVAEPVGVDKQLLNYNGIRIEKYFKSSLKDNARILLRTDTGEPLLSEHIPFPGGGKVFLLTTTLDRAWTNFPAYGAYVTLWQEILRYCSEKKVRSVGYYPAGTVIEVPVPENVNKNLVTVETIIGDYEKSIEVHGKNIKIVDTRNPGIYRVSYPVAEHREVHYAVVNPNPENGESALSKDGTTDLRTILRLQNVAVIQNNVNTIDNDFRKLLYGSDASTGLSAALFLILLAESVLAGVMTKKREDKKSGEVIQ